MLSFKSLFRVQSNLLWFIAVCTSVLLFSRVSALDSNVDYFPEGIFDVSRDPFAEEDPLSLVDNEFIENMIEDAGTTDLASVLTALGSFEVPVFVNIVLVGFDAESGESTASSRSFAEPFLKAMKENHFQPVISGDHHEARAELAYRFRVTHARPSLHRAISNKIEQYIRRGETDIPYSVVDKLIANDYEESSFSVSYALYLINTDIPFREDGECSTYSYVPDTNVNIKAGMPGPCGLSGWVGRDRYIWQDLTAGPVRYGPTARGEGITAEFSVPSMHPTRPGSLCVDGKVEEAPFSSLDVLLTMSEVFAYVHRALRHVITPSMTRIGSGIGFSSIRTVQLVLVRDHSVAEGGGSFQWSAIEEELRHLLLPGQTLDFVVEKTTFHQCMHCAAAFTNALKGHTSAFSEGPELRTQIHQYLDSWDLVYWLDHLEKGGGPRNPRGSWPEGSDVGGTQEAAPGITTPVDDDAITVYVFDLEREDLLLLDRFHQAASHGRTVVAVQTRAPPALANFFCEKPAATPKSAESARSFDPADATRPVLGAVLNAGWGVPAIHEAWETSHMRNVHDYQWSTGLTPHGPLSSSTRLSFSQVDAAKRNTIINIVSAYLADVEESLSHFADFGLEPREALSPDSFAVFQQRWVMLQVKLNEVSSALHLLDFTSALYYARSLVHEVEAFYELVHHAGDSIHSFLQCPVNERARAPSRWMWLPYGLCVVSVAALLLDRYRRHTDSMLVRGKRRVY
eukprot:Rmarinus@m.20072